MSNGKKLYGDREGDHAEEVHPLEKEEGEGALEEGYRQDEEHHPDEEHSREEEEKEVEEEEVHPREYGRPDLEDVSSLAEWHYLAGQP